MTTKIDLREIWREDWKELISHHEANNKRTAQMITRIEYDLVETVPPPPKPYVKELKKKLTLIELLQFPKAFLP